MIFLAWLEIPGLSHYVHMMYSNSNWCGRRVALEDCNKRFQDEKSTSTVANIVVIL